MRNYFIQQVAVGLICLMAAMQLQAGHPMPNEMKHESIDVPDGVLAPQLSVTVHKDMMSGFNLHLQTRYFQLEPPEFMADKPAEGVQGHAHLYINEKKIGRLYGPYVHIPASQLKEGINIIAITLNDHHHKTWRYQNKEMIVAVILNTMLDNPIQSIHSPFPLSDTP